ncbi:MAG: chloride channel protein [Pirellulaceae bacterium]|nr:chloride channel protein [Planctomycetales bacterium]
MSYFHTVANRFRSIFDTEASGRLILFSPIVGIVAGLGAVAFFFLLQHLQQFMLGHIEGYYPPPAGDEPALHAMQMPTHWWAVVIVPVIGGLVCGMIVYGLAPEAEGHGTDAMVRAFHRLGGRIRARVPFVKAIASIVTISTGGSAGREGPIAQIGAGFGSLFAERIGLGEQERRLLMLSGGAGGIGAIFRAPLGGALFVSEVLYGSTALEFAAVIPCFIASITAYAVFAAIYGQGLAFNTPPSLVFDRISELPFYVLFAVVCGVAGYAYVTIFYGLRNRVFKKLPVPNMIKPAIGGLGLGIIALWLPQLMSGGYGWIQLAINGKLTLTLMAILCIGKIVTTSLTISSGGSGGVFAPSLFIGAMLGGAYGQIVNQVFPGALENPEAFVLVGMGGFFAGVARVPLTAMIMVCEMSGSYGLLIPLMLVSIMNTALLSSKWTLYEEQVNSILDSPAHTGDFVIDVLEQIHVRDVLDTDRPIDFVREDLPITEIMRLVSYSQITYFPVVDRENRLTGIFSLRDLRAVLMGNGAGSLILAADIAVSPVLTVTVNDDLHTALRRFTQKNIDYLPVVDTEDSRKIVGMLSRRDVIGAYHDRVTELQQPASHDLSP